MRLSATSTSILSKTKVVASGGGGSSPSSNTAVWSMRYHMYGADTGEMKVYVQDQSGNFTQILQKTGQQQTSSTDAWDLFTYNLMPSFAGQDIRIYIIVKHSANVEFKADVALDDMKMIINGTTYGYSGSTNAAAWREGRQQNSESAAQAVTSWYALNAVDDQRRWNLDSGGPTPSSDTGPDAAYDGNNNTQYIYYEASVDGLSLTTTHYYPLRIDSQITIPA